MIKKRQKTLAAACVSYMVESIVNTLAPLLFVTFREQLGVSLAQLSILITLNFFTQILVDTSSTFYIRRLGYRRCVIVADICALCGLVMMGVLPRFLTAKFAGLVLATLLCALGGGLLEVVVSPLVEAIPGDSKSSTMCFLHSAYCWGQAGVILLSSLYFWQMGTANWYLLPILWAALPACNALMFLFVPVYTLAADEEKIPTVTTLRRLVRDKMFWLLMVLMLCAGAAEVGMSQWASLFAEQGLGISKALGDLLGPCAFALCMGIGRLCSGIFGKRTRMERWIPASFLFCTVSYFLTVFARQPSLSLLGCALCGLSVSLLWPCTCSTGGRQLAYGGTITFSLFAFAGDIGCIVGPDIIGMVSEGVMQGKFPRLSALFVGDATSVGLKTGMLLGASLPLIGIAAALLFLRLIRKKEAGKGESAEN